MRELEEQKNNGFITLEEYDTLRIRYERKLGNKEAVSKLQEAKGFKPSNIIDKKAKKEELYDDFVDKYSSIESKDYTEINKTSFFSEKSKWIIIILLVILAFAVGIVAGVSSLTTGQNNMTTNITVTNSAFSPNSTLTNATNLTAINTTKNATTTSTTKKSSSTLSYSSSSSKLSSSSNSSSSSCSSRSSDFSK